MMTRDTYRRRERALVCHAQIDRAHSEKSREETLKELAEPLLDEALIRDVILSWTRPLPSSYLTSPLVLVGPSGVGKNRLVKYLRKDYNKFFAKVVTHTTRQPRSEEINGTHYHFVSTSRFAEMVECEAFLEHSVVHGRNSYGLSMEAYKKVAQQGKIAIFEVDVQGARKLRAEGLAELHNLTPRYIFIAPTSIEMLRERLVQRGTEDDADIAIRLETAAHEIETSKIEPGLFDRVLVNEDLEKTAHALFRAARDWYPALPSPARLRMLQRRLSKIKRLGVETTTAALSPPPSNGPADSIHYSHEESGKNE
jgi:guanylate kinase